MLYLLDKYMCVSKFTWISSRNWKKFDFFSKIGCYTYRLCVLPFFDIFFFFGFGRRVLRLFCADVDLSKRKVEGEGGFSLGLGIGKNEGITDVITISGFDESELLHLSQKKHSIPKHSKVAFVNLYQWPAKTTNEIEWYSAIDLILKIAKKSSIFAS